MVIYKATHVVTAEARVEYFSTEVEANAFAQENKTDYPTWTIIPLLGLSNLIVETENDEEEFDELDNSKLDDEK
ncbi:MAG TPA: hypothetical protein VK559_00385 [Ferruginibacter sp.]|nr:hypothetical protein [Ferruginibacter sp.]